MPIYEYQCTDCGHELEALQKMSEDPLQDCPECGKPALQKLVSAAGFRLKGGGWYETDFKKTGRKNVAESKPAGGDKASGGDKAAGGGCGSGGCGSCS
ncbi:MAG TPA: zinc ribbon domain-containing protein [Gammaproteobacteria bacterium]|nr:zinc ribbon domain-containing protein [Gammaproteobacteria bacterium]